MSALPVLFLGGAASSAPIIVSGGNTVVDYSGGSVRVVIQGGAITALGTAATHAAGDFQPINASLTALAGNTSSTLAFGNVQVAFGITSVATLATGSANGSFSMAIAGGNALTLGSQFGSTLKEPHWRLDFSGGVVSTFRNVNVAGSSAISFRDYLNVTKLTIGHGNDSVSGDRAGTPFAEFVDQFAIIQNDGATTAVVLLLDSDRKLTLGVSGAPVSFVRHGTATLVSGVKAVSDANISASTRVLVTRNGDGGTPGCSYSVTRSNGVSFTITSKRSDGTTTETSDTSTLAYMLIEP